MSGASAARVIAALALGLVPVACTAAPSTRSPATARPQSPTVSGSLAPDPSEPRPGDLGGWQRLPPQVGLENGVLHSVVSGGDMFLAHGCRFSAMACELPGIWESADGLEWITAGPVSLPPNATSGRVDGVSTSRFGSLAVGSVGQGDRSQASIWLRDASGWLQATPPSGADAWVGAVMATDERLIAVGSEVFMHFGGFRAWWSADGRTWQASPPVVDRGGYPTDLVVVDGGILAWGPGCGDVCGAVPSAWWLSVDGTAWQPFDRPRGLENVWLTSIERTDDGFVAFGFTANPDAPVRIEAWTADTTAGEWRSVEPPIAGENSRVFHHLVVGGGSVAAGTGQVGPNPEQSGGLVWLRGPGESAWRAPIVIPGVEIVALVRSPSQPNRVSVLVQSFEGSQASTVTWTGLVDWAT